MTYARQFDNKRFASLGVDDVLLYVGAEPSKVVEEPLLLSE
jgi:hypothetical protein